MHKSNKAAGNLPAGDWQQGQAPSHLPLKWPQQQAHSVSFSPAKHCVCRHLQDPKVWRPEHSARFSPIKNMHKVLTLGIKSLQKAAAEGQGREGSCFSLGGFALFCSCLYFSAHCHPQTAQAAYSTAWHQQAVTCGTRLTRNWGQIPRYTHYPLN